MTTYQEKMNDLVARRKAFVKQIVEKTKEFDQEANMLRNEERKSRRREEREWRVKLERDIWHDYNFGPKEVAKMIVDRAWDEGHSYGYDEVKAKAESLAEYTEKVVRITEKNVRIKKNGSD